jgi:NADH:ubiquinone oxidoreductase subunit B-like Fe-S oxidoreductase
LRLYTGIIEDPAYVLPLVKFPHDAASVYAPTPPALLVQIEILPVDVTVPANPPEPETLVTPPALGAAQEGADAPFD